MESAGQVIERLDCWLAQHRPEFYASLKPGLTDLELAEFEQLVGFEFPKAFREFYRWRNGEEYLGDPFMYNRTIMPQSDVREAWKELSGMQECGEWEQPQWYCRGWIPFLDNGGGSYLCLDLHGSFTGKRGQVIEFWCKDSDRPIVAEDFLSWLTWFVDSLETGDWHLEPDSGNFEPRNEKDPCHSGPLIPVIRGDANDPPRA
jgi:cell wall assembly regulator SMI1